MLGLIVLVVVNVLEIVISLALTVIVSVSVALWQNKRKRLVHYFINSYDIGKGLTDDFPDFQLYYGSEALSNNVRVLKGGFMNLGRNDIGEHGLLTDIRLTLPPKCNVRAVKVSPSEKGLDVKIKDTEDTHKSVLTGTKPNENINEVIFEIDGLFQTKEFFNYSVIIEVPDEQIEFGKQLSLDLRIKDTKLRKLYLGPNYKEYKRTGSLVTTLSCIGVLCGCISIWTSIQLFGGEEFKKFGTIVLVTGFVSGFILIFECVSRRWEMRGRVIHELLKKQNE